MADEPTRPVAASQHRIRSARRLLRAKERAQTRTFLVEGPQAVREALAAGVVLEVFRTDQGGDRLNELAEASTPVWSVDERELASLTETVRPQGVVAVCRIQDRAVGSVLHQGAELAVCCAAVRDPGNAGTVIRCADAFGADGVLLTEDSVDLYNGKTVRASVGSIFHLPVVTEVTLDDAIDQAQAAGLQVLAADGSGDVDLTHLTADATLARPTLWVFGNEAWGLPQEQLARVDRVVRVPMYGKAESLNLSTAAAVCLYASATAQRNPYGVPGSPS